MAGTIFGGMRDQLLADTARRDVEKHKAMVEMLAMQKEAREAQDDRDRRDDIAFNKKRLLDSDAIAATEREHTGKERIRLQDERQTKQKEKQGYEDILRDPNATETSKRAAYARLGIDPDNVYPKPPTARSPNYRVLPNGDYVNEDVLDATGRPTKIGNYRAPKDTTGAGTKMNATDLDLPIEAQGYIASLGGKKDTATGQPHTYQTAKAELLRNLPKMATGNPRFNSRAALSMFNQMYGREPGTAQPEAGAGPAAGGVSVQGKDGKPYTFPNQAAADAFKRDGG